MRSKVTFITILLSAICLTPVLVEAVPTGRPLSAAEDNADRRLERVLGGVDRVPSNRFIAGSLTRLGRRLVSEAVAAVPERPIFIDNAATITITGFQDGAVIAEKRPLIQVSCGDSNSTANMETLQILIDGVDRASDFTISSSLAVSSFPTDFGEGQHTFVVSVANLAGQVNQQSFTFYIDTTGPQVTSSLDEGIISNPTPTVTFQFSDSHSVIDENSIIIELNGQGVIQETTLNNGQLVLDLPAENGLVEGENVLRVLVADQVGNGEEFTLSLSLDTNAPGVTISPRDGSTLVTAEPTIRVNVGDGGGSGVDFEQIAITLDGIDVTASFQRVEDTLSWTVNPSLSAGNHVLSVTAQDELGQQSTSTATFSLDVEAPTISSVFPGTAQILTTDRPVFRVIVADNGFVNTPLTTFQLDGEDRSDKLRFIGDTILLELPVGEELGEGNHSYSITIEDSMGNPASKTTTFKVDTVGPQLSVAPNNGDYLNTTTPVISISATDDSGIDQSSVRLTVLNQDFSEFVVNNDGVFQIDFSDLGGLIEGSHSLELTVKDSVGNETRHRTNFVVDTVIPEIYVTPVEGAVLTQHRPVVTVELSDSLPGSGVDMTSATVTLDGVTEGFDLRYGEGAISLTPNTDLAEGSHTVSVTVRDRSGNEATKTVSFATETDLHHFDLEISPSNVQGVPVLSVNDLTVSARTLSGALLKDYEGFLEFSSSTGTGPLHGFVLLLRKSDEGIIQVPGLASFAKVGTVTISTHSLNAPQYSGSMTLEVVPAGPVLYAPEVPLVVGQSFQLHGLSRPNSPVEIREDSTTLAEATTNVDGTFTVNLSLSAGSHNVVAASVNPKTDQLEISAGLVLAVQNLPAFLSELPANTNQPVLAVEVLALPKIIVELVLEGEVVAEAVTDAAGKATLTFSFPEAGEYAFKARMTIDEVVSDSSVQTILFDTTVPQPPIIIEPRFSQVTELSGLELVGLAQEQGTLFYSLNEGAGVPLGSIQESFTFLVPAELSVGKNDLRFWMVDLAGNTSSHVQKSVYYGENYVSGRINPESFSGNSSVENWDVQLFDGAGQSLLTTKTDKSGLFFIPQRSAGNHLIINPPAASLWSEKYVQLPEEIGSIELPPIAVSRVRSVGSTIVLDSENKTTGFNVAHGRQSHLSVEIPAGTTLQLQGRGILNVRRIESRELPVRLPAESDPRFLIEVTPHGTIGDLGATLTIPNLYNLPANGELIVYGYHYGRSSLPSVENGWTVHRGLVSEDERSVRIENIDTFSVFTPQLQVPSNSPNGLQSARQYKVSGSLSFPKKPGSPIWLKLSNGATKKLAPISGVLPFEFDESLNPNATVSVTAIAMISNLMVKRTSVTVKVPAQGYLIDLGTIDFDTSIVNSSFLPSANNVKAPTGNTVLSVSMGGGVANLGPRSSVGIVPALHSPFAGHSSPILSPLDGERVRQGFSITGEREGTESIEILVDGSVIASSANSDPQFLFAPIPGTSRTSFTFTPSASHFGAGGPLAVGERTLSYRRSGRFDSVTIKVFVENSSVPGGSLVVTGAMFPVAPAKINPAFAFFELSFSNALVADLPIPTELSADYALRLGADQDGDGEIDYLIPIKLDRSVGSQRVVIYPNGGKLIENSSYYIQVGTLLEDISGNTLATAVSFPISTDVMPVETFGQTSPTISNLSPMGAGVSTSTPISIRVSDAESGVDMDTVSFEVTVSRSGPIGTDLEQVTSFFSGHSSNVFYSNTISDADIRLDYPGGLPSGAVVRVKAIAGDFAGNQEVLEWSFTMLEDSTAPTITMDQPIDGENHVSAFTPVVLTLGDLESGIDASRSYIEIAGVKYSAVQQYQSNFAGVVDAALTDEGLSTPFPSANGEPNFTHAEQNLPFDFPFEGKQISNIRIYAHGYIDLVTDQDSIAEFPEEEGTAAGLRRFTRIAPFWARLKNVVLITKTRTEANGQQSFEVRWKADTNARAVNGVSSVSTANLTFAVRFFEDGRMAFRYDGEVKSAGDLTKPIRGLSGGSDGGFQLLPQKDLWEQFESRVFEKKTEGIWQQSEQGKSFTVTIQPNLPLSGAVAVHYHIVNGDFGNPRVTASQGVNPHAPFTFNIQAPNGAAPPSPIVTSIHDGDTVTGRTPVELVAVGRPGDVIVATEESGGQWRGLVSASGIFRAMTDEFGEGTRSFTFVAFDAAGQASAPAGPIGLAIEDGAPLSPNTSTPSDTDLTPNIDRGPTERAEIRVVSYYSTLGSRPEQYLWLDGKRNYWTPGTGSQYVDKFGNSPEGTSAIPSGINYVVPYRQAGIVPNIETYAGNLRQFPKSVYEKVVPGATIVPVVKNDVFSGGLRHKIGRVRFEVLEPSTATFVNGLKSVDAYYEQGQGLGPAIRFGETYTALRLRVTHLDAVVVVNGKLARTVQSLEVLYTNVKNGYDSRIRKPKVNGVVKKSYIAHLTVPEKEFVLLKPPTEIFVGDADANGDPLPITPPSVEAGRHSLLIDGWNRGDLPFYEAKVTVGQGELKVIPSMLTGTFSGTKRADNVIVYTGSTAPIANSTITLEQPYLEDFTEGHFVPSYERKIKYAAGAELGQVLKTSRERSSSAATNPSVSFYQLDVPLANKIVSFTHNITNGGMSYFGTDALNIAQSNFNNNPSSIDYKTEVFAKSLVLERLRRGFSPTSFYHGMSYFHPGTNLLGVRDLNPNTPIGHWLIADDPTSPYLLKHRSTENHRLSYRVDQYEPARIKVTEYSVQTLNGLETVKPISSRIATILAAPTNTVAGPYKLTRSEPKAHVKAQEIQIGSELGDGGIPVDFQFEVHDQFASFIPANGADVNTAELLISGPNMDGDFTRVEQTINLTKVPLSLQDLTKWEREVAIPYRYLARNNQNRVFYPGRTRIDVTFVGKLGQASRAIYEVEVTGAPGAREAHWIHLVEDQFPAPIIAQFLQGLKFQTDVNDPGGNTSSLQLTITNPGQQGVSRTVPLTRFLSSTAFISSPTIVLSEDLVVGTGVTIGSDWPVIVVNDESRVTATFTNTHQYTPGDRLIIKGINELGQEIEVSDLSDFGSFVIEVVVADVTFNSPLGVSLETPSGMRTVTLTRVGTTNTFRSPIIVMDPNDPVASILENKTNFNTRVSGGDSDGLSRNVQLGELTRDKITENGSEVELKYEAHTGVTPFSGYGGSVCVPTGEFVFTMPLHSVPSAGMGLNFVATYRSRVKYDSSPLGNNWDHNYNVRIKQTGKNAVLIMNGRRIKFTEPQNPTSPGRYDSPAGFYGILEKSGTNNFRLVDRHGTVTLFRGVGSRKRIAHVKSITDRNSNKLIFEYTDHGDLRTVEDRRAGHSSDSVKRTLTFVYQGTPVSGDGRRRLKRIVDFTNRVVRFSYHSDSGSSTNGAAGDLASVIMPLSKNFTSGTGWYFKYSPQQDELHNLTEVYDPAGTSVSFDTNQSKFVAAPKNLKALILTSYSPEDVVSSQRFGRPLESVNSEGGEYLFAPSGNQVVVTDPIGVDWTYLFSSTPGTSNVKPQSVSVDSVIKTSDPNAAKTTITTHYEYNDDEELAKVTKPLGNGTNYTYRREENTAADHPNALNRGNLVKVESFAPPVVPTTPPTAALKSTVSMTYYEAESSPGQGLFNQLKTTTDPLNHITTIVRDSNGNIEEQFESVSKTKINGLDQHTVSFPLTATGSPLMTGNNSQILVKTTYKYNPGGLKREMVSGAGGTNPSTTRWEYDDNGFVELVISGESTNSNVASLPGVQYNATTRQEFEYDPVGNLIKQTNSRGTVTVFVVNERNETTEIIRDAEPGPDSFKYRTKFKFDERGLLIKKSTANVLPKEVRNQSLPQGIKFDASLDTVNRYDARGLLIESKVEQSQGVFAVTKIHYDAAGREILRRTPKAVLSGDMTQNVKTRIYDQRGLPLSASHIEYVRKTAYDENGNVVSTSDDSGSPKVYEYDGLDRLASVKQNAGMTADLEKTFLRDAKGRVIEEFVTGRGGVLVAGKKILGHKLTVYDERDIAVQKIVKVYNPLPPKNIEIIRNRTRFDERGRLVWSEDEKGNATRYGYDSLNRQVSKVSPFNPSVTPTVNPEAKSVWNYDSEGNVTTHKTYEWDPSRNQFIEEEATREYDALNRLVTLIKPDGSCSFRRYDSLNRVVADADSRGDPTAQSGPSGSSHSNLAGFVQFRCYDGLNNEIYSASSKTPANSEDQWSFNRFTSTNTRVYDRNSNLLIDNKFDVNGMAANETRIEYDDYNRPVAIEKHNMTDLSLGQSLISRKTTEYDKAGRVSKVTDENSSEMDYEYDPVLGHLKTLDVKLKKMAVVKGFDINTRGIKKYSYSTDGLGRILSNTTEEDGFGTVTVTSLYDTLGRPVKETTNIASTIPNATLLQGDSSVSYKYAGLERSTLTYGSGYRLNYERDHLGRLVQLKNVLDSRALIEWTGASRPSSIIQTNGVVTRFSYESGSGRLLRKVVEKRVGASNLVTLSYRYDGEGNVLQETRSRRGNLEIGAYSYDALGRLTSSSDSQDRTVCDNFSARSRFSNQRLLPGEVRGGGVIYSTRGLMMFDGNYVRFYDSQNRLVKVSKLKITPVTNAPSTFELVVLATYHFDGLNRRAAKVVYKESPQAGSDPIVDYVCRYNYDQQMLLERTIQKSDSATTYKAKELRTRFVYGPEGILETTFFGAHLLNSRANDIPRILSCHTNSAGRAIVFANTSGDVYEHRDYGGRGTLLKVTDAQNKDVLYEERLSIEWVKPGFFEDNELKVKPICSGILASIGGFVEQVEGLAGTAVNTVKLFLKPKWSIHEYRALKDAGDNLAAGVGDGAVTGVTLGLYQSQIFANMVGADTGSSFYIIGTVVGEFTADVVGSILLGPAWTGLAITSNVGQMTYGAIIGDNNLVLRGAAGLLGDFVGFAAGRFTRASKRGMPAAKNSAKRGISSTQVAEAFDPSVKLNRHQRELLAQLQKPGDMVELPKKLLRMGDMVKLSGNQGVEFALFTKGGRRRLMRGDFNSVPFTPGMGKKWAKQGWKWSGHVHPVSKGSMLEHSGYRAADMLQYRGSDLGVLYRFTQYRGQWRSAVYAWNGEHRVFRYNETMFNVSPGWGDVPEQAARAAELDRISQHFDISQISWD